VSPPGREVSRRGFLAALKPQNVARAVADGLARVHVAGEAPEAAPDPPQWRGGLERVLEQMNDLSGIEEGSS
jgi:hypothetical protein